MDFGSYQKQLLVIVMSIGRQNVDMNFCFKNTVNKPMLLRDFSTPSAFWFAFQWLWMAQASLGMLVKFTNEFQRFLINLWFIA